MTGAPGVVCGISQKTGCSNCVGMGGKSKNEGVSHDIYTRPSVGGKPAGSTIAP